MDTRKTLNNFPYRFTFGSVLYLLAVLYFSVYFLAGETFFEMPNNWFVTWMAGIFQQMDTVGFFNVWSGQSPGFHYLYYLLWKPATALAGGEYYFGLTFTLLWAVLSIGSLFLSAYLFNKIVAHLWGEKQGLILGTIYILLFLTMPKWYEVIDSVTIAGLLGAIYLSLKNHNRLGGAVLGITATLKPIGLLILPVILKSEYLTWKARVAIIASSLISFIALLLPLAIGNFKIFMSPFNWQSGRPPWESIYAFFLWILNKPFPNDPIFQDASGAVLSDWGKTGITPPSSIMTTPVSGYHTWYNALFIVLLAAVIIGFLLLKRVRSKQEMLLGVSCLLGAYFAFFYGWSFQFIFWLLPFLMISFPLAISITMRLLTLLEYPFFYAIYLTRVAPDLVSAAPGLTVAMTAALSPMGAAGYWSLVIIRTLLILAFAVIAWRRLPTQVWDPVFKLGGLLSMKQKIQLVPQEKKR